MEDYDQKENYLSIKAMEGEIARHLKNQNIPHLSLEAALQPVTIKT